MLLTRFHKILLAALVVQLGVLALVLSTGRDRGQLAQHVLLRDFDAATVTKIEVSSSPSKPSVELSKGPNGWVVSSAFDYPVDEAKVTELVTPLAKMSAATPIATQASRHKQLHVADDDYERKVAITAGGKTATLFIGGSAGTRRNAVRFAGDDDVYAVTGVAPYLAGDQPRDWIAASYVAVAKDDIAKITVAHDATTVALARDAAEQPWTAAVDGAPILDAMDTAAIDKLADAATSITAAAPGDPKRDASKPAATITIEQRAPKAKGDKPAAASALTPAPIVIDIVDAGEQYWVNQRDLPRAAMVDKTRLEPVVKASKQKLVKPPPPPAAGAGSAAAGHGSGAPVMAVPPPGLDLTPR